MSDWQEIGTRRGEGQHSPVVERVASECDLYGHDYQVNEYGITATGPKSREPSELFCSVCGESWKVER